MDTSTVLTIIGMLDNKIDSINQTINNLYDYEDDTELFHHCKGLEDIRDHLQSFIESQLNGAENKTGE